MRAIIIAVALAAAALFTAQPAECVYCPDHTCYGSASCGYCVCVQIGGDPGGRCAALAP